MDETAPNSVSNTLSGSAETVVQTGRAGDIYINTSRKRPSVAERREAARVRWEGQRRFAEHVLEITKELADGESFEHSRYTELEAEVEMEGRTHHRHFGKLHDLLTPAGNIPQRVKSLSVAVERTAEKNILVEGVPGAGKSIALRHTAQAMAKRLSGRKSAPPKVVLPLYVNLKTFRPPRPVTSDHVAEFVKDAVNPHQNARVRKFLETELPPGLDEGEFLFLFDSFDEIPDILSSTDVDEVVQEYITAISTFLGPFNRCRGVLASREYRGPGRIGWPRFRILALTEERQHTLAVEWNLDSARRAVLFNGLETADPELRTLAHTPLVLSLLCLYVETNGEFPDVSHKLFSGYVNDMISRHERDFRKLYNVGQGTVRLVAEHAAFLMASTPGFGLQVDRPELRSMLRNRDSSLDDDTAEAALRALEYAKIARPVKVKTRDGGEFTFIHRRIQEYFATCVVLENLDLVPPETLVLDHNWRETAVTMLQSQADKIVEPVLRKAEELLTAAMSLHQPSGIWPKGSLHLLSLMSAGLAGAQDALRPEFRGALSLFLESTWNAGRRHDKFWVLEIVGLADTETRLSIIRKAFESPSSLLRGEAYRQAGLLPELPHNLALHMRKGLLTLWGEGRLRARRSALRHQIRQLEGAKGLLRTLSAITVLPVIEFALSIIAAIVAVGFLSGIDVLDTGLVLGVVVIVNGYVLLNRLSLEMLMMSPRVSWATRPRKSVARLLTLARFLRLDPGPSTGQVVGTAGILLRLAVTALMVVVLINYTEGIAFTAAGSVLIGISGLLYPSVAHYLTTHKAMAFGSWLVVYPAQAIVWVLRACVKRLWRVRYWLLSLFVVGVIGFLVWLGLRPDDQPPASGTDSSSPSGSPAGATSAIQPTTTSTPTGGGDEKPLLSRLLDMLLEVLLGVGLFILMSGIGILGFWLAAVIGKKVVMPTWRYLGPDPAVHPVSRTSRKVARDVAQREGAGPLSVADLTAIIDGCERDRDFWRYLNHLRKTGRFGVSGDVVGFLSDLAATAEHSRGRKADLVPGTGAPFREWMNASPRNAAFVQKVSEESVDEISRVVIESEHAARQ
ncbi:NACHT domain-containing protein [Actinosynnema sp. CA-299493]